MKKVFNVKSIVTLGMLGALSAILMMIEVPIFFAPSFMKFDISNLPALFAGFFFGPIGGLVVVLIKDLIHLSMSTSMFIGELMDFVSSSLFVLCASLIYNKQHTRKGAIISLIISSLVVSIASLFLNYYIFYPMFLKALSTPEYSLTMNDLIDMAKAANPAVKNILTMMLFSVLPFNLIKYGIISVITYLVYKKSSLTLRRIIEK